MVPSGTWLEFRRSVTINTLSSVLFLGASYSVFSPHLLGGSMPPIIYLLLPVHRVFLLQSNVSLDIKHRHLMLSPSVFHISLECAYLLELFTSTSSLPVKSNNVGQFSLFLIFILFCAFLLN